MVTFWGIRMTWDLCDFVCSCFMEDGCSKKTHFTQVPSHADLRSICLFLKLAGLHLQKKSTKSQVILIYRA